MGISEQSTLLCEQKLLTSRQIFRYAVPARTVTKKALVCSDCECSHRLAGRLNLNFKPYFGSGNCMIVIEQLTEYLTNQSIPDNIGPCLQLNNSIIESLPTRTHTHTHRRIEKTGDGAKIQHEWTATLPRRLLIRGGQTWPADNTSRVPSILKSKFKHFSITLPN